MDVTVRALRPVYGGRVIAREDGVLFVRGALPGELVRVSVRERKRDFAFADVVEVIEPSPRRVAAPCPVYGICGGCHLQHADYDFQLELKKEALSDVLRRTGKLAIGPSAVHRSSPFGYRFRGQFKAERGRVGFYKAASRELVPVPESGCPLMIGEINARMALCREAAGGTAAREIHVVSNGSEVLMCLKGPAPGPSALAALEGRGADGIVCEGGGRGRDSIVFRLGELSYAVSARSFFQANWRLNLSLVERVAEIVRGLGPARLLDLYAGAGNFSLPLARVVADVVAVEESADAFADLSRNIAGNGLGNCRAVRSRIERFRPGRARSDVVIVDPPREGLSDKAFRLVRALAAPLLLYVSCSPPTLARDLAKLCAAGYAVESIDLYDFFPNSYHIETLTVLKRRR